MSDRKTCECGVSVKDTSKCGFYTAIDQHRESLKHKYMLELKETYPELWQLVLRKGLDVAKVECPCGQRLYRWSLGKHAQSKLHIKVMARKGLVHDT